MDVLQEDIFTHLQKLKNNGNFSFSVASYLIFWCDKYTFFVCKKILVLRIIQNLQFSIKCSFEKSIPLCMH